MSERVPATPVIERGHETSAPVSPESSYDVEKVMSVPTPDDILMSALEGTSEAVRKETKAERNRQLNDAANQASADYPTAYSARGSGQDAFNSFYHASLNAANGVQRSHQSFPDADMDKASFITKQYKNPGDLLAAVSDRGLDPGAADRMAAAIYGKRYVAYKEELANHQSIDTGVDSPGTQDIDAPVTFDNQQPDEHQEDPPTHDFDAVPQDDEPEIDFSQTGWAEVRDNYEGRRRKKSPEIVDADRSVLGRPVVRVEVRHAATRSIDKIGNGWANIRNRVEKPGTYLVKKLADRAENSYKHKEARVKAKNEKADDALKAWHQAELDKVNSAQNSRLRAHRNEKLNKKLEKKKNKLELKKEERNRAVRNKQQTFEIQQKWHDTRVQGNEDRMDAKDTLGDKVLNREIKRENLSDKRVKALARKELRRQLKFEGEASWRERRSLIKGILKNEPKDSLKGLAGLAIDRRAAEYKDAIFSREARKQLRRYENAEDAIRDGERDAYNAREDINKGREEAVKLIMNIEDIGGILGKKRQRLDAMEPGSFEYSQLADEISRDQFQLERAHSTLRKKQKEIVQLEHKIKHIESKVLPRNDKRSAEAKKVYEANDPERAAARRRSEEAQQKLHQERRKMADTASTEETQDAQ